MRILKTTDAGPGVCGLALTPSVALGGYLIKGANHSDGADDFNSRGGDQSDVTQRVRDVIIAMQQYVALNWRVRVYTILKYISVLFDTFQFLYMCDFTHLIHHFIAYFSFLQSLVTAGAAFCFTASLFTLMYMCISDCCQAPRRKQVTRFVHSPVRVSELRELYNESRQSTPTRGHYSGSGAPTAPVYPDSYQQNYFVQPTAPLLPTEAMEQREYKSPHKGSFHI